MKTCRECQQQVEEGARKCPHCGAQYPDHPKDGWGFEYKDKNTLFGLPIVHISFKYRPNGTPVPARGIVSIGQFGIGVINISQFGIGVISVSQFSISVFALSQFAIAYSGIAQIGVFVQEGVGQFVTYFEDLAKYF